MKLCRAAAEKVCAPTRALLPSPPPPAPLPGTAPSPGTANRPTYVGFSRWELRRWLARVGSFGGKIERRD
jgi:hypothetical protein